MAEFITMCPHCGSQLEVESSWQGLEVKCSICSKKFTVSLKNKSMTPLAADNSDNNISDEKALQGKKKEYFFGRLYITIARIVAIIILAITVTAVILLLNEPFTVRKNAINELKEYSNPKIIAAQNKLNENYIRFAQLMLTANKSGTDFKFPEDINRIDAFFNNELLSEEAVIQSIKTLELYQGKIEVVSSHMLKTFTKHTDQIERLLSGGNAIVLNISSDSKKKSNAGELKLTIGQNVDFYKMDPEEVLRKLFLNLERLNEIRMANSKLTYGDEIDGIKKEAGFIDKTLNNKRKNISLASEKNDTEIIESETKVVGKEQYILEKRYLYNILIYINFLSKSENWKISEEAKELKMMLLEHQKKIREISQEFKENLKNALISAGLTLLSGIFTAFLIMVFADYLLAHFDSAISLKSLDRKIKSFLFLPLAGLLLLTGCGVRESPEKLLANSVESLRTSAIMTIFANHISVNENSTVYGIPDKKLVFVTGGQKASSIMHCGDLKIASISPCFNIAVLSCTSSASVSSLRENKVGKYSHEAVLSLSVSYEICNTDDYIHKNGTPGVAFHFLIPDNLSNDQEWVQNKFNKVPTNMPDHAVAINRVEKLEKKTSSEFKTFKVLFNSETQKWELENAAPSFVLNPIPTVESFANINLNGTEFEKLSVNASGKQELLFIHKNDYETVNNIINKGLVLYNGHWKKRYVVEQTVKLQQIVEWWIKEEKVSLNKLKDMLQVIKECPEAENYAAAVELAENALIKVFIDSEEYSGDKCKELAYILNFINSEPYTAVLNRKKLAEYCQNKIIVEQTAKLLQVIEWWNKGEKTSLNEFKNMLQIINECPNAKNYAAAVELAENVVIKTLIDGKENPVDKRKSLSDILNFINNEPSSAILNRKKLAEYCQNKIVEIDNFFKSFLPKITNAKKDIDDIIKRGNFKELKAVLDTHKWFYYNSESKAVLDKLIKIYNRNSSEVDRLYKERDRWGKYNLLSTCVICRGSGLKNCKHCNNSGRCKLCSGTGYRKFTTSEWNGHTMENIQRSIKCTPKCDDCRGRTLKCNYCRRGVRINEKKLQNAIVSEIMSLKKELTILENYCKKQ